MGQRLFLARTVLLISGLWLLLGQARARAQFPNVDRGYSPSGMFEMGGVDSINGFNGNLVIRIPLGQASYPVGGTMGSYSFDLYYNSNVWDYVQKQAPPCDGNPAPLNTLSVVTPNSNAGLGWNFSLGRLGSNQSPYQTPPMPGFTGFVSPDGTLHAIYNYLAALGGQLTQPGMSFSNDGCYLRHHQAQDGSDVLEFPDGRVQTWTSDGGTTIKDKFGNGLTLTVTTAQNCPGTVWAISDGFRNHQVCFRPTGYSYPDEQATVIDHIDVASFGGTATYWFLYNDEDQYGNGFHEIRLQGTGVAIRGCVTPQPTRVMLLTQLLLPDGTSYRMPSSVYTQPAQQVNGVAQPEIDGMLTHLGLPTSGAIGWVYEIKNLPQPHTDDNGLWYVPVWSSVPGVNQRSLYDTGSRLIGTWQYNQGALAEGVTPQVNELVNETVYPSPDSAQAAQGIGGHRVVTYYGACVYGECTDAGAPYTYGVDFGRPFSRRRQDANGLALSQEIYAAPGTAPIRQVWVNYESDANPNPPASQALPIDANERQLVDKTLFLDDPVPGTNPPVYVSTSTTNSGYDGLGHYRIVAHSDTTSFAAQRTETIDWNPDPMPGPTQPWLLDTYDYKEQQEGADVEHQEAVFEPATGFLTCMRQFRRGAFRGPNDVFVLYGHDGAGQVTSEAWFGGDTQHLPVTSDQNPCTAAAGPVYSYNHGYSAGVRNLTTVTLDAQTTLKLLDSDIDTVSGLVSTSREPATVPIAGRATSFTYDLLGRPLTIAPAGDATVQFTYSLSDTSPPFVDRTVGGSLEEESWQLDGAGRVVAHTAFMPNRTPLTSTVTLNAMGWKTFESVPSQSPGNLGTSYLDYDPFGRPQVVRTADNKTTYFTYRGASAVVKTQAVWNGTRELPVNTRQELDGLGRLRRIQDPTGVWTSYRYDAGGRIEAVNTNGLQSRTFAYDGRGFLASEVQPEDGKTSYRYDAKGNVTMKATPTGTVLSSYDPAGRLASVSSPLAPAPLKQFTYGSGFNAGKVIQASAFNWRQTSSCTSTEVRQNYTYDQTTGRLASEGTSLWQGSAQLESWAQSYAYDGAGRVTQVGYPSCTYLCPPAPRQVTTTYSYGKPTSVSGFATSITYADNGLVQSVTHGDGVVFTITPDVSGMPRPGALQATLPAGAASPWQKESYLYDTAGNIKSIGGKSFAYDADSRIVSATMPTTDTPSYQGYTWDAYNNLTSVASGASAATATTVFYFPDECDNSNPLCTNRLSGATYDGSGHLAAYQGSTYTWDVLGQITSLNNGSEQWTHLYDAAEERVWSYRTSPSPLDNFALREQDGKLLSVFTKTGSTYSWEDYAYREGRVLGDAPSTGPPVHLDVDHLGSVRLETSGSAGSLAVRYHDYLPFGLEATPLVGSGSERMKFAGQERDLGVLTAPGDNASVQDDIDYMHARYYRGLFGRFLSVDPAKPDPKQPQGWNRYAYVQGRPLLFIDPTGEVLEFTGSDDDKAKMEQILNSGMFGQSLTIGANGIAKLGGNGDVGPPSLGQSKEAELLGSAIDNRATTAITLVHGDTGFLMAHFADHKLDVADIAAFGNGPGPTAATVALHEIVEQYAAQVYKADYKPAHQVGIAAENAVGGYQRGEDHPDILPGGASARITTTYKMNVGSPVTVVLFVTNANVISVTRQ